MKQHSNGYLGGQAMYV